MKAKKGTWLILSIIFACIFCIPAFSAEEEVQTQQDVVTYSEGEALWSKDELETPLAVGGRINKTEGSNQFSFEIEKSGIPLENLIVRADLNDERVAGEGYDKDALGFNGSEYIWYLGSAVDAVYADGCTYTDNNALESSEGEKVDMIKGAQAVLSVRYNPEFTHQKGCFWYAPNNDFTSFDGVGGSDSCTVYGDVATFSPAMSGATESVIIRALSIYDPWFDAMEQKYDEKYRTEGDTSIRVDNWKTRYLELSSEEHRYGVNFDYDTDDVHEYTSIDGQPLYKNTMWEYPSKGTEVSIYADFQVTVREPIEDVVFVAHAQADTNKQNGTSGPSGEATYRNIENQLRHPDIRTTNAIWCYDTSDAGNGEYSVDAFYVEALCKPDYGYELQFEIVEGSTIGSLDNTEIDSSDNAFRFVPKGEYTGINGQKTTNYGAVTIKVTAEDVNYVEYFTLHYLPSNLRFVKYIGKKAAGEHESTVPDTWNRPAVIATDPKSGRYYLDTEKSGEWDVTDVTLADGSSQTEIYGLNCLVLYPGETFELAAVSYVHPDAEELQPKTPYYMTSGYPSWNSSALEEEKMTWTEYAVMFSVYQDSTAQEDQTIAGLVEFVGPGFANIVEGETGIQRLEKAPDGEVTAHSWWYRADGDYVGDVNHGHGDAIMIRGLSEGAAYLAYTIVPIAEDGSVNLSEGTLTGGFYIYVVNPVDQELTEYIYKNNGREGAYRTFSIPIPYSLSISQWEHWYLGKYGLYQEEKMTQGGDQGTDEISYFYRGRAFASFDVAWDNLIPFGYRGAQAAKPISKVWTKEFRPYEYQLNNPDGQLAGENGFLEIDLTDLPDPGDADISVSPLGQGEGLIAENEMQGMDIGIVDMPYDNELIAGDTTEHLTIGGLNAFPLINAVRIKEKDSTTKPTLFEANLTTVNGKKTYDLSTLKYIICYEHSGIGYVAGDLADQILFSCDFVKSIKMSQTVDSSYEDFYTFAYVDLGDHLAPNYLTADLIFEKQDGFNISLKKLDIGYNCFDSVILENFAELDEIELGGTPPTNQAKGTERVFYYRCDGDSAESNGGKLSTLTASNCNFNRIVVGWPSVPITDIRQGNSFYQLNEDRPDNPVSMLASWDGIMIINDSPLVKSVSVSGGLTYLELKGNNNLTDLYSTESVDREPDDGIDWKLYEKSEISDASGSWISLINLGGTNLISQPLYSVKGEYDQSSLGFNIRFENRLMLKERLQDYLTNEGPLEGSGRRIADKDGATTTLETIRLNNIWRLWADAGEGEALGNAKLFTYQGQNSSPDNAPKETTTVEIHNIYGGYIPTDDADNTRKSYWSGTWGESTYNLEPTMTHSVIDSSNTDSYRLVYDVLYSDATRLQKLSIDNVYGRNTRINFINIGRDVSETELAQWPADAGSGSDNGRATYGVFVTNLEGLLDLRGAGLMAENIKVNTNSLNTVKEGSAIDLSGSLIRNFSLKLQLTGISMLPASGTTIDVEQGASTQVTFKAQPSVFDSEIQVTPLAVSGAYSKWIESIEKVSNNTYQINVTDRSVVKELPDAPIKIEFSVSTPGVENSSTYKFSININVTKKVIVVTTYDVEIGWGVVDENGVMHESDTAQEGLEVVYPKTGENPYFILDKGAKARFYIKNLYMILSDDEGNILQDENGDDKVYEIANTYDDSPGLFDPESVFSTDETSADNVYPEDCIDGILDPAAFPDQVCTWDITGSESEFGPNILVSYPEKNVEQYDNAIRRYVDIEAVTSDAVIQFSVNIPFIYDDNSRDSKSSDTYGMFLDSPDGSPRYSIRFMTDGKNTDRLSFYDASSSAKTVALEIWDLEVWNGTGYESRKLSSIPSGSIGIRHENTSGAFDFKLSGSNVTITPKKNGWDGLMVDYKSDTKTYRNVLPVDTHPEGMLNLDRFSFSVSTSK